MSVPAPSEKYSAPSDAGAATSPKPTACRATAPGTSILAGMAFLAMRMGPRFDRV